MTAKDLMQDYTKNHQQRLAAYYQKIRDKA